MLLEFRRRQCPEGTERAVDRSLLVDLDDVLTHRLGGDEELAALGARDVADVGVLLDVFRVAVASVSCEWTLVAFVELHAVIDHHLVTRKHVSCTRRSLFIIIIIIIFTHLLSATIK